ncbi:cyclic nucleotide-binding/CBS domain-containing protein [Kitasatospora sp. DSM 101779]|uniref:CBS domain-containing protein n=1 Tax=Kitasatospora sp. DSM 101779 TaxID=2853165 RepID=UPI0021D95498|nr:CBS domain-containing protein [Kitasatospora sp. DSM 101779]MCU7826480.1 CBS domain-containing protein [Kitasatospora sp. DSM 101779]
MRVADLMISPPVTVPPDSTAAEAARLMADRAIGCVLVGDSRTLLGVLTDRDLVVRVLAGDVDADTSVARLMSAPPLTVHADEELGAAYRMFRRTGVRRLPVLRGGAPVGVITVDDLFLDVLQHFADLLGPVSRSTLHDEAAVPPPERTTP